MVDMDITKDIQIGQDAEESKLAEFPSDRTPDCGYPTNPGPPARASIPCDERVTLVNEPFQRVLSALADLERDDPKLGFQEARILGIYRRL
ncbi:hypothetical protein N7481_008543 [Penicillium waksmanii]|uniref:uncharacterized protein n=1 Tax=Penicillium waksmanii TaxID=69791 RepID=UPI002549AC0D|nr:uncharacterized protein N7481_008543 [Penicillium waksmanii]KAJ5974836.1 hypothetical protein N7481_008543 [Penicillium waksmanii]